MIFVVLYNIFHVLYSLANHYSTVL